MAKLSRTELARRFLDMRERYPQNEAVAALAHLLVDQGRSQECALIVQEIGRELLKRNRHLTIHLTSARAATPELSEQIATLFKQKTGAKTAEVIHHTDPSILGGAVARALDYELDLSLKHKLEHLEV